MRNQKDFLSGLVFVIVGGAFAFGATGYEIGSASNMGPGYFPLLVGGLTALVGAAVMLKAALAGSAQDDGLSGWAWRPLILIIGANLLFGVMLGGLPAIHLPPMGLVVGVYALVFVASLANSEFRFGETFALSTILAVAVYGICVKVLKLYVPLWPQFVTG